MLEIWSQLIDWLQSHSSGEPGYVLLIVILFVVPRLLLRFGIPMALTSLLCPAQGYLLVNIQAIVRTDLV